MLSKLFIVWFEANLNRTWFVGAFWASYYFTFILYKVDAKDKFFVCYL